MARKILRIWEQTHRFSGEVLSVLYVYENSKKKFYDKKRDAFIPVPPYLDNCLSVEDLGTEVIEPNDRKLYVDLIKDRLLLNENLEEDLGNLNYYKEGDFLYSKSQDLVFIYSGEWMRLVVSSINSEGIYVTALYSIGLDLKSEKIVDKLFPIEYRESDIVFSNPVYCRKFKKALDERGLVWKDSKIIPKDKKLLFKAGQWICEAGKGIKNPGILLNDIFEGSNTKVSISFGINSETNKIVLGADDWLPINLIRKPYFWERWYLNYKYWKYERVKKSKGD